MTELTSMQQINLILERLTSLASNIHFRGRLNLTDMHVLSEDFFAGLLNIVYGLNLRNANIDKQNTGGIDLVDDGAKVIIQVSATCSKQKINHSLDELGEKYRGYHFRFLSIVVGSVNSQKRNNYLVPYDIVFNPKQDILDISTIVKDLQKDSMGIQLEKAAEFIKKNLHSGINDEVRLMSGLEYVIVELSKDSSDNPEFDITPFRIDVKIDFNGLSYGREIIKDYSSYYTKIQHIYDEYSNQGQNKSKAVLQKLHNIYLISKQECSGDDLFRKMEKELFQLVDAANMPKGFSKEELEMYVDILMVHAFMECKIFEKPV